MKILIAMPADEVRASFIPENLHQRLGSLGQVIWNETPTHWTHEELKARIPGVDVCILGWGCPGIDADILEAADCLKVILHTGGSVSGFVSEAVYDRGIAVLSGNELFARSVAEGVIAYALCSLRDLIGYNRQLLQNGWRKDHNTEGLLDQTVGLIGFGAVARHTAQMLSAFGVKLFINADHVTEEEAASYGAKKATLDQIMSSCKIISVHLARTPETYHLINAEKLAMIPDGALFINTARGSIIDEAALAEELKKKRFKAMLDVYEVEPLPMDSPLRQLDNVLLIPHMAGPTLDRRRFVTEALLDALPDALNGQSTWLDISREMMRRMTTN